MNKHIFTAILLMASVAMAWAVPARKGAHTIQQANGEKITVYQHGDEFCHWLTNEAGETIVLGEDGNYRVAEPMTEEKVTKQRAQSPMYQHAQQTRVRKVGALNLAPRGLFILVNYKDTKFQASNSQAEMDSMMNAVNYTHQTSYGSARRYFIEQSGGQYQPVFDVVGPVTLDNNASYYGGNDYSGSDKRPATMILHACKKANEAYPELNFADYDNDHDGYVDFVYVIFAGKGEADGGAASTIWPHSWSVQYGTYYEGFSQSDTKIDGVYLGTYACSGELNGQYDNRRCGIGTLCHEFSHVLGLPDYYDTEYGTNYNTRQTPSEWSLMDGGSYNSEGEVPPCYSAYDKWYMGWSEPELLNAPANGILNANDAGYYITKTGAATTAMTNGLRYVVENRQQSGWDKPLPGHGMLVWKVNYNQSAWDGNTPNNTANAPKITVVSATGSTENIGKASDSFPGTNGKTSWSPWTNYPLTEIKEQNGVITFKFMGGVIEEYIQVHYTLTGTELVSGPKDNTQVVKGKAFQATFRATEQYQPLTDENCTYSIMVGSQEVTDATVSIQDGILTISLSQQQTTGDIQIQVKAQEIEPRPDPDPTDCDNYSYEFTTSSGFGAGKMQLGDYEWLISREQGSNYGFDANRGLQIGSQNTPALSLSMLTQAVYNCQIQSITINASIASSGDGKLSLYIGDTQLGNTQKLTTNATDYTFENTEELLGDLEIRFSNSKRAMYLKSINIEFVAFTPTAIEHSSEQTSEQSQARKVIRDGQLLITIDGNAPATYNAQGQTITK